MIMFIIFFEEFLIEYFSDFFIKVVGIIYDVFVEIIVVMVIEYDFEFYVGKVEMCFFIQGKYLLLILIVCVISCIQLDNIYCVFFMYEMVKFVF